MGIAGLAKRSSWSWVLESKGSVRSRDFKYQRGLFWFPFFPSDNVLEPYEMLKSIVHRRFDNLPNLQVNHAAMAGYFAKDDLLRRQSQRCFIGYESAVFPHIQSTKGPVRVLAQCGCVNPRQ